MIINSDFTTEIIDNFFIVSVNLTRATFKEVNQFNKILSNAIRSGYDSILIEMCEVEYIDSTFLGALVVNLKKLMKTKSRFSLVGLKPSVYTIVQNTHLNRTFNIFTSRDEALKKT